MFQGQSLSPVRTRRCGRQEVSFARENADAEPAVAEEPVVAEDPSRRQMCQGQSLGPVRTRRLDEGSLVRAETSRRRARRRARADDERRHGRQPTSRSLRRRASSPTNLSSSKSRSSRKRASCADEPVVAYEPLVAEEPVFPELVALEQPFTVDPEPWNAPPALPPLPVVDEAAALTSPLPRRPSFLRSPRRSCH